MAPTMGRIGKSVQAKRKRSRSAFEVGEVDAIRADGVCGDLVSHLKKVLGEGATGVTQTFCVLPERTCVALP